MQHRLANVKHLALDLDGTLYLGGTLFEFTRPFLALIKTLGIGRTFFTNNSSRSTKQYVEKLNSLGIDAGAADLYSSTHCTLEYLREHHADAKRAFILGTHALREEFREHGFVEDDRDPDLVLVGFDTTLSYDRICRAAWWVSRGKPFIATHPDRVCPTDEPTLLPDCGAICWAWAYSTELSNCGFSSVPQPKPGYVQLCCTSIGLDGRSSIVTSCADWGSCGIGSIIRTDR
jgi:NagD protein